jgi:hypothetical protein
MFSPDTLAIIALVFALIPALGAFANAAVFRAPRQPEEDWTSEPMSILIPARDEAHNIAESIESALSNIDADSEVVVLDDGSSDGTGDIVRELAKADPHIRLIAGKPLPDGAVGKLHACHQLSEAATKPLLLFVDADVRLEPGMARRMAFDMEQSGAALLSGFPRQLTGTFVEKLLIPLIHFVLLGFLSIRRMRGSRNPAYGTACGQIMLARTDAYRSCGGHGAVLDSIHDGLDVPRTFRRDGHLTDLCDITELCRCRMYTNGIDTVKGLEKNATRGMASPLLIVPFTGLLFAGQILPFLLLAAAPWIGLGLWGLAACFAAIALTYAQRFWQTEAFKGSWLGAVLHPLGIGVLLLIQWAAFFRKLLGFRPKWKGRALPT